MVEVQGGAGGGGDLRSSTMWFALLQRQPRKGLPESGSRQRRSDLDLTFHALCTITHWSHAGARRVHRGRNGAALGAGHFRGEPVHSWQAPGVPSPLGCTLGTPEARGGSSACKALVTPVTVGVGGSPSLQPAPHLWCPWNVSASLALLGGLLHRLSWGGAAGGRG